MSSETKIPAGSDDADLRTPEKSKKGNAIPDISPTGTGLTSAESYDRSPGTQNSVLTIEHKAARSGGGGAGRLMFGLSKPMFGLVALLVLGTGGTFAYALSQWFRIPGLQTQIEELELEVNRLTFEVDRLTAQVDRLAVQNDRLESLNDRLNSTVVEFEALNVQLNASNVVFEMLNGGLNMTALELQDRVEDLQEQNEEFATLNTQLNETNLALSTEVDRLENATSLLERQNEQLFLLTESLSSETAQLEFSNEQLNETNVGLQDTVVVFELENNRLTQLNSDLGTIVSFLNATTTNLNETFEAVSAFLADQINVNRFLVMQTLQNTYQQRLSSWDCDFRDAFRNRDFVSDGSIPIGADDYPAVVAYVDEQLLTNLCLDQADFEQYLESAVVQSGTVPPVSTTVNQLITGVQTYTNLAVDYYFPDNGDAVGGLTDEDWVAASYNCQNLPAELQFSVTR
jgi:flagellin-like hook-associated protein FlgL